MKNQLQDAFVLIVDDTKFNLDLFEAMLVAAGARVVCATDGRKALDILKKEGSKIDLVLSDIRMPEIDGIELTRRIREDMQINQLPVILMTSDTQTDDLMTRGLEAGANDYLKKPVNEIELVARSRSMIKQKRLYEENLEFQRSLELKVIERTVEIEMTRDVTMFGFAKLAEFRDPETGEHLERIREYTKLLTSRMSESGPYREDIDKRFVENIYKSSPLHDIGKVGIPDNILLKPGKLTAEEFEIMKKHAKIGGITLEEADERLLGNSFLSMAKDVAMFHHERWDGTGYPSGLKGGSIPLAARIMALADVYDALCSKRVYKEAMSHDKVHKTIVESSGTHFDPVVVEAYVSISNIFLEIRDRFRDRA